MNFEQAMKYRNSGFTACPYCESTNIEADMFDHDIQGMDVVCVDCGKEWQDNYNIVSVAYYDDNGYHSHGIDLESRLRA